jgi:hypothetical protein
MNAFKSLLQELSYLGWSSNVNWDWSKCCKDLINQRKYHKMHILIKPNTKSHFTLLAIALKKFYCGPKKLCTCHLPRRFSATNLGMPLPLSQFWHEKFQPSKFVGERKDSWEHWLFFRTYWSERNFKALDDDDDDNDND